LLGPSIFSVCVRTCAVTLRHVRSGSSRVCSVQAFAAGVTKINYMSSEVHVTRSSRGCHSRCNSIRHWSLFTYVKIECVCWAIKPQPELNVFAHDLMRRTKGLGRPIDRKSYTHWRTISF